MKNILAVLFILFFGLTSFYPNTVEKKTYWLVAYYLQKESDATDKMFGAKIIEASTEKKAIAIFNKFKNGLKGYVFSGCNNCDNKTSFGIKRVTSESILK